MEPLLPLTPLLPQRLNDFDLALRQALAAACADGPERLQQALAYAVLNGGKRIRPQCAFMAAHIWQVPVAQVLPVAVAVELIHAQSLVHDDLPCMDDDDMRRGQPTVHKAYDEACAVLVGDALLAHAFAVLTKPGTHGITPAQQIKLVFELSHAYQQLVSGQMMDIAYYQAANQQADDQQANDYANDYKVPLTGNAQALQQINRLKTAALFKYTLWAVGYLANMPEKVLHPWTHIGEDLGLLFQQCDDWHDQDWSLMTDNSNDDANTLKQQAAEHLYQVYADLKDQCRQLHPKAEEVLAVLQPVLPAIVPLQSLKGA
jgi:geranylgeranyl pyrophosphate synthase